MQQALDDSAAAAKNSPVSDSSMISGKSSRTGSDSLIPMALRKTPGTDSLVSGSSAGPATGVVKLSEKRSSSSLRQVYTDVAAGRQVDTIVVIIPVDTVVKNRHAADTVLAKDRRPATTTSPATISATTTSPATLSAAITSAAITSPAIISATIPSATDTSTPSANAIPYINSDCHNFATDYDIDRLRVKMLDAPKDEDRIAAARKVFKTKCFYTPQLRALSEVFTTDAAKFQFFEAAWPYAADEHFHELSGLLSDPVYIGKFKTMTGAQP
jgi:hypothetical protein